MKKRDKRGQKIAKKKDTREKNEHRQKTLFSILENVSNRSGKCKKNESSAEKM